MDEQDRNDRTDDDPRRREKTRVEEFEVQGDRLLAMVKDLIKEGSIRRISIRNEEGRTLLDVPLALGVAGVMAGAMMAPVLAAIGAVAALVTKLKVVVERVDEGS